jgi:hypothetical protein
MRGPGWYWQEERLIADLFAALPTELIRALGFDADQALACAKAVGTLGMSKLPEHMSGSVDRLSEALEWAGAVLGGDWRATVGPVRNRAIAGIWALMHAGEAMLVSANTLAKAASIPEPSAAAFMRALSVPFGQEGRLFEIAERVRYAPFIPVGDSFFATVPGNVLWAGARLKGARDTSDHDHPR